jgi:hypothetical protein
MGPGVLARLDGRVSYGTMIEKYQRMEVGL